MLEFHYDSRWIEVRHNPLGIGDQRHAKQPKSFKDRLDEGGLDFDEGGLDFDEVEHVPSYLNAMANDW